MGGGTTGFALGWVVNFHPRGINLFAGMDYPIYKVSKQYIPKNSNASFCVGINLAFGKSRIND